MVEWMCEKHRGYRGRSKPTCACPACWYIWVGKNPWPPEGLRER